MEGKTENTKVFESFTGIVANEKTTEVKEAVMHLESSLTYAEVSKIKPVVNLLIDAAEVLTLKYDKEDKNSIILYKKAKKENGSFNTKLTALKKELKESHTKTSKAIDVLFNKFKESYTLSKNHLEKEFKPYLDELAAKKAEKIAMADALKEEELKALKEKNKDILAKQKIIDTVNIINDKIITQFNVDYLLKLNSLSKEAIHVFLNNIGSKDLATIIFESNENVIASDLNTLPRERNEFLNKEFTKVKLAIEESYRNRLKELIEKERMIPSSTNEVLHTPPPIPPTPFSSIEVEEVEEESFLDKTLSNLEQIQSDCEIEAEKNTADKEILEDISAMLKQALEFVNKKR